MPRRVSRSPGLLRPVDRRTEGGTPGHLTWSSIRSLAISLYQTVLLLPLEQGEVFFWTSETRAEATRPCRLYLAPSLYLSPLSSRRHFRAAAAAFPPWKRGSEEILEVEGAFSQSCRLLINKPPFEDDVQIQMGV